MRAALSSGVGAARSTQWLPPGMMRAERSRAPLSGGSRSGVRPSVDHGSSSPFVYTTRDTAGCRPPYRVFVCAMLGAMVSAAMPNTAPQTSCQSAGLETPGVKSVGRLKLPVYWAIWKYPNSLQV